MKDATRRAFFVMLKEMGAADRYDRQQLIRQWTNGRTISVKAIKEKEAQEILSKYRDSQKPNGPSQQKNTKQFLPGQNQRRKIISMAHQMGWQKEVKGEIKIDMKRVNEWCKKVGKFKKELNQHTVQELTELVAQFALVYTETTTS